MAEIKRELFLEGVDNQKRPNISYRLKRDDIKKIDYWTQEERNKAKKFLKEIQEELSLLIAII